jgi:hypothetical protein
MGEKYARLGVEAVISGRVMLMRFLKCLPDARVAVDLLNDIIALSYLHPSKE